MDVIKFKLSDYEWYRVITIINGTKINKYADKAENMRRYYAWVEDYCRRNGGKECNKKLIDDYSTFIEEYNRLYGKKDYNKEQMRENNSFVKEYYNYYKEIESVDNYGDGIYPGWLYHELAVEPYIPYISKTAEITTSNRDGAKPDCAAVLGCACGIDGCSQYLVRITETENSVIWDDYFAHKFNQPNYFHFEFEKKQYYGEVEKLVDLTLQIGERDGLPVEIVNNIKKNHKEIDKENNSYVKYPQTLCMLIEQMDSFSEEITGYMFDLACYGKRKEWKGL